jgi:hypothetical protein
MLILTKIMIVLSQKSTILSRSPQNRFDLLLESIIKLSKIAVVMGIKKSFG